jgi:hypothetical protein
VRAKPLKLSYDGRQLRMAGDRASLLDPLDGVRELARLVTATDKALREWVARARARGASWTDIGDALGTTKQAAWERFGRGGS